jgi:hypothetical protein
MNMNISELHRHLLRFIVRETSIYKCLFIFIFSDYTRNTLRRYPEFKNTAVKTKYYMIIIQILPIWWGNQTPG